MAPGDKPEAYPIEHGFDEMKHFAAYYPGVYTYNDTSTQFHPWFPSYNAEFKKGTTRSLTCLSGKAWPDNLPEERHHRLDYLATFDVRQADSAIDYIKSHAKNDKPFFMNVNFMKMHNPTNPAPQLGGGTSSATTPIRCWNSTTNIGRMMDAIRAEAPNTIVIVTADNGAWQDAYPDAGTVPFRGRKAPALKAASGCRD